MGIITEGFALNEPENQAIVQDLLWVWNAPPLMALTANWLPQRELGQVALDRLTAEQWVTLRQARQGKLGAYFEALVCALIECSDQYHLLARGVVIQGDKRTLGELDVLIQHRHTKETVHLELALKFYLQVLDPATQSGTWIGPGLRDFLRLKHQHLKTRQLTLPVRAHESGDWPGNLPFPDRSLAWVTGRLYYPWSTQPNETDPLIEPGHLFSHWLRLSDFKQQALDSRWLSKGGWLSGHAETQVEQPRHGLPAQCFGKLGNDPVQSRPKRHWFIVPDDWPDRARISILQRFG